MDISKRSAAHVWEIMHMEKIVARVATNGKVEILNAVFMPYDLYLDEEDNDDLDVRINNINNFNHWCASRVLSLDRKYAKELLNSIGAVQAIVELSLKGRQMTVTDKELAPDLSTKGCFPKAWIRTDSGFKLLKAGNQDSVKRELLASEICQCFDIRQVIYQARMYDGEPVTESDIVTSKELSIVSKLSFDIYAINHNLNTIEICKEIDPITYYGMNILDYLTGNTDRHPENWGFLVDNSCNKYISLYPLMDFNQCFQAYDHLDGARCLTVSEKGVTQREAAKCIGLRQKREVDLRKFGSWTEEAGMFEQRLAELKKYA